MASAGQLADEAFKSAGSKRSGNAMRAYGCPVDPSREAIKPGDVVEFRSARFSNCIISGPEHAAAVMEGGCREDFTIAEQNWCRKSVRLRKMIVAKLISGKVVPHPP